MNYLDDGQPASSPRFFKPAPNKKWGKGAMAMRIWPQSGVSWIAFEDGTTVQLKAPYPIDRAMDNVAKGHWAIATGDEYTNIAQKKSKKVVATKQEVIEQSSEQELIAAYEKWWDKNQQEVMFSRDIFLAGAKAMGEILSKKKI